MKKYSLCLVQFLLCLVAFLGCGGNGSDSSASSPVLETPAPPDTWRTMAQNQLWNATFHPRGFSLVWTGSEMILWGPLSGTTLMTGALYDPLSDTWSPISTLNAPGSGAAVWTGEEMIVCTGYETGMYNPTTDRWRFASATNQPNVSSAMSVWTGTEMIVWGYNSYAQSIGGKYNPNTDTWSAISGVGAPPSYPVGQTIVWTGSRMIVWTGIGGAAYDPVTDVWTPVSGTNAPSSRFNHLAVWTGNEMIIWGGQIQLSSFIRPVPDGRRYNPFTDFWSFIYPSGSIWAMQGDAAVWTGTEMLLWTSGGGAAYNPAIDVWRSISSVDAPNVTGPAVWTGTEILVWSGEEGGRYTP